MSKPVTIDDFGAALSEFVALTAYRIATSPHSPVGKDEMRAFDRTKSTLAALLAAPQRVEAER